MYFTTFPPRPSRLHAQQQASRQADSRVFTPRKLVSGPRTQAPRAAAPKVSTKNSFFNPEIPEHLYGIYNMINRMTPSDWGYNNADVRKKEEFYEW